MHLGTLLRCLKMHGVSGPESASRKPPLASENLHYLQRHQGARWPVLVVSVLFRPEINSSRSRMEARCAASPHGAVVIAPSVLPKYFIEPVGVETIDDSLKTMANLLVTSDGVHGLTIILYA